MGQSASASKYHQTLGRLTPHPNGLLFHVKVRSSFDYTHWRQLSHEYLALEHALAPCWFRLRDGRCFEQDYVEVCIPEYRSSFQEQILKRRTAGRFTEREVWYVLFRVAEGLSQLQSKGLCAGDMHPRNILFTRSGEIKLLCTSLIPCELNSFQHFIQDAEFNCILAPEQINFIIKGDFKPAYSKNKAEIFCLGCIALLCFDLEQPMMHGQDPKFQEHIEERIASLRCSGLMRETLRGCLSWDPKDRCSAKDLMESLGRHRQKIVNFHDFHQGAAQSGTESATRSNRSDFLD